MLSTHRSSRGRPLPELVPFPFRPDDRPGRKRNFGKVPKPSKFVKGEMYFSDYETDLECAIPAKWRPGGYCSDNDEWSPRFRSVRLGVDRSRERRSGDCERHPSPPCPHKWESHEEIDRLIAELKKPFGSRTIFSSQKSSISMEALVETTEQRSTLAPTPQLVAPLIQRQGEASHAPHSDVTSQRSTFNQQRKSWESKTNTNQMKVDYKGPGKIYYKSETSLYQKPFEAIKVSPPASTLPRKEDPPSASSESAAPTFTTCSSTKQYHHHHQKRRHVTVKDKARMLEQKVEETMSNSCFSYESANDDLQSI